MDGFDPTAVETEFDSRFAEHVGVMADLDLVGPDAPLGGALLNRVKNARLGMGKQNHLLFILARRAVRDRAELLDFVEANIGLPGAAALVAKLTVENRVDPDFDPEAPMVKRP